MIYQLRKSRACSAQTLDRGVAAWSRCEQSQAGHVCLPLGMMPSGKFCGGMAPAAMLALWSSQDALTCVPRVLAVGHGRRDGRDRTLDTQFWRLLFYR
jgi:hypothetical protein